MSIKKNDQVMVIAGKDKGKTGKVLQVMLAEGRILVEGINFQKKAVRKSQENPNGGHLDIEKSIHISNVMLLDKKLNKPSRFGVKILNDGSKVRISKKSGEVI
ncbi:MAG: 50S ribosomal protein L24 [Candidatus Omnitrophica bacterium]|nr:50S ribosomal protein L24 [Candidatus Omnitrophota bacterium]